MKEVVATFSLADHSLAETIVQLFRLGGSGVIAPSHTIPSGSLRRSSSERKPQCLKSRRSLHFSVGIAF